MSLQIAKHRIKKLFSEADKIFPTSQKLANRYVNLARKIAMKMNISLTKTQRRKYCKHCYHYLRSGVNSRTRIHKHRVVISCNNCKKYTRIPIKTRK